MELHRASYQWASRPDDERFSSLQQLLIATKEQRARSKKSTVMLQDLSVADVDGKDLVIKGRQGKSATMSHWAFGQLAARCGAPPSYLRDLPAKYVSQLLNHGISNLAAQDRVAQMLFWEQPGSVTMQVRAFTSEQYTRIWNCDIVERLLNLQGNWKVPPAMDHAQRPSGLYAGDHDMFVFLVNDDHRIDDGSAEGLGRGFFIWNTEVGGVAFGCDTFYYRYVCGNHIVWGATNVKRVRIRHVGIADTRAWHVLGNQLHDYMDDSASQEEARIRSAQRYSLGATEDDVIERIFKLGSLSKKTIKEAYVLAAANESTDGSPRTVWGLLQGLTRLSQREAFADRRVAIDRAAGKLMEISK